MAHPILDQAFEKHAQDYLCSESYDFIKEVRDSVYVSVVSNLYIFTQTQPGRMFLFIFLVP